MTFTASRTRRLAEAYEWRGEVDDDRILEFERALWIGDGDIYRRCVAEKCVMVVPERPFLLSGEEAIEAVDRTPRWSDVDLYDLQVSRAQEGLIVIGYRSDARRDGERFTAYCTGTYQRVRESEWEIIQHQQTLLPPVNAAGARDADDPTRGSGPDKVTEGAAPDLDAAADLQKNDHPVAWNPIPPAAGA